MISMRTCQLFNEGFPLRVSPPVMAQISVETAWPVLCQYHFSNSTVWKFPHQIGQPVHSESLDWQAFNQCCPTVEYTTAAYYLSTDCPWLICLSHSELPMSISLTASFAFSVHSQNASSIWSYSWVDSMKINQWYVYIRVSGLNVVGLKKWQSICR